MRGAQSGPMESLRGAMMGEGQSQEMNQTPGKARQTEGLAEGTAGTKEGRGSLRN